MKISGIAFTAAILFAVVLIIIPVPTVMMDTLLILSIALSIIILLIAIYSKNILDFSVFPTLLLLITIFRLALNIRTTYLILSNNGNAGEVVAVFSGFVTGGNLVVGIIIFVIILIIQFIVITKGAERVAEVSARFTLDALPGKQMSIDADLNTGAIDDAEAQRRRDDLQREVDFHGAMDGASKFIKGDTIAGLLITVINIVAGLIIGITMGGMAVGEAAEIYSKATIGDGLVSQIPALLISTSAGIIVTRSGTNSTLGEDVTHQLFGLYYVLITAGIVLFFIGLIPGIPKIQTFLLAGILITVGFIQFNSGKKAELVPGADPDAHFVEEAAEKRKPENVTTLLDVSPIELEFGYGIVPMIDVSQGGDLLDRIVMIRRQAALDLGIIVPSVRLRDNIQLGMNQYQIKIKGVEVADGEVMADHLLALSTGDVLEEIYGIPTVEPTFGLPALWIQKAEREKAELYGYSTIDPPSVIATHLTEVIKQHGHELLNRQQVQTLIEHLTETQPTLVDEVVPKMFSYGEIQKVLAALLKENVPIRDMGTIIETLGDYGSLTRDTELLTEYVRQNLKRMLTNRFIPDHIAHVLTLDSKLEQLIIESTRQSEHGAYLAIDPTQLNTIYHSLKTLSDKVRDSGHVPISLTSPLVRRQFRKIAEQVDVTVLSFNEVESDIEVVSEGVIHL
jgi:flagellar biosynthesis protein FlhA